MRTIRTEKVKIKTSNVLLPLRRFTLRLTLFCVIPSLPIVAQVAAPVPQPPPAPQSTASTPASPASAQVPITLDEAITRARANQPVFAAAVAANRNAVLDRSIARSALLPSVIYHNQYLYTQPFHAPNGAVSAIPGAPRFIANNSVHEYVSQGSVTETIGPHQFNAISRASTSVAITTAELEIATRGLTSTVVGLFYSSLASERKLAVAQRAATEAAGFTTLTQQRESAREVARADVVKAQLTQQQRERDLLDARLLAEKSRLDLAVLLFPDPRSPYSLSARETPPAPPARADVEAALARRNPELQSALATSRLAGLTLTAARLAYFPDLILNYSYGIDATQWAARATDGAKNLGYSASATLDIPIWDWFITPNKVRQARNNRDTARAVLSNTQRRLIAQLEEFYNEAVAAHDQLKSFDESVATATESLRLTRLRYTSGEATVLEVVDAQNSLTTSELTREDGIVRYQAALANLQLLTGTL
jgi:outer membrane protein